MKYITQRFRRFCCFIAGFTFFISGVLKLLDPAGAGLVMNEYFRFLHLGFMIPAAKSLGTALAFAEATVGAAMITGVWRRLAAMAAIAFQAFFTLLTLILVIFNPEMDCGCFGEAIHLTHMQTFLKNIVLCLLLAGAYLPFREFGEPKPRKYVSFGIVVMSLTAFMLYSWYYIPLVDFTDFKPGTELQAARASIPQEDMYEAVFIYEKEGRQEKFTLEHLPDSTWTFVSTETVLKDGFQNAGVGLSFYDADGEYMDSKAADGKVMIISVYDMDIRQKKWSRIARMIQDAETAGFSTLLLAATTGEQAEACFKALDPATAGTLESKLYFSDYKTLVTMNRSNGGLTYFDDGELVRKWAYRAAPDKEEFLKIMAENATEASIGRSTDGKLTFQGFLLYVTAVMLLL